MDTQIAERGAGGDAGPGRGLPAMPRPARRNSTTACRRRCRWMRSSGYIS